MTAHYSYIFTDLRTSTPLEEIPLSGVYITDEQNNFGDFQGTYYLDSSGYDNSTMIAATKPGRCGLIVERNGIPIWDGYVKSRWYQSQEKVISIYAKTIKTYPEEVYIDTTFTYTNVEQTQIFLNLWTTMQADANRNIQVGLPSSIATGVLKSADVHQYEFKSFGSAMSDLANGDNGFDWTVLTAKTGGFYSRTLRLGYPYLGKPFSPDSITLEYPGPAILNYYETETQIATHTTGQGSGSGTSMLQSLQIDTSALVSGLRFDRTISFKDVNNQVILNSLTNQAFVQDKPSIGPSVIKLEMKADQYPNFGDYNLGDYLYFFIKDARHPTGLLKNLRLIRWELRPPESAQTEAANLIFAGAQ